MRGKLFLTGAKGMVGSNIREHPSLARWDLLAPDRTQLDLTDRQSVEAFLVHHKPDVVIHAAGRVGGIHANMAHPTEFLVENVDIGRNVIVGSLRAGVTRLLNLGSSCMYPRDQQIPLTEDMILAGELEPTNEGYAISKIFATRLCQFIRRENPDLLYKTLIPCNLYGRYDKFDPSHSHLLPAIIYKIHKARMTGRQEIEIWGDGTARREFMYAGDFADAVMRAVEEIDLIPELMNIGLEDDHSVNDYYQAAAHVLNWTGTFIHDHSRPVGMTRKKVDIERQAQWGWSAGHGLAEGIAKTYQYYIEEVVCL